LIQIKGFSDFGWTVSAPRFNCGMRKFWIVGLLVVSLLLPLAGCKRVETSDANVRTHQVRGIVRGFAPDRSSVDVQHEDIPGFMPSMTMPFTVKEQKEIANLKIADAISFRMTVTDKDLFLDQVKKIATSDVHVALRSPTPAVTARVAERLKEGEDVPFFALTNQDGARITSETFQGHPFVLTFVFTRCPIPNFCPRMSHNFADLQEAIKTHPELNKARLLSVTLDPAFDTPAILKSYGEYQKADSAIWNFATGEQAQINTLTQSFGVFVQPEGGTISHGLATALIGADGSLIKIWRGNAWQPSEVLDELRKL
jgi:protein SCO1/2